VRLTRSASTTLTSDHERFSNVVEQPETRPLPREIMSIIWTYAIQSAAEESSSLMHSALYCFWYYRLRILKRSETVCHPLYKLFLVSKAVKIEVERLTSTL
jgi:hypothetical protein